MEDTFTEVPGSAFTHGELPTHASAIAQLEKAIGQYRRGLMTGAECVMELSEIMEGHADARKSNIAAPSNPMWNCCRERPAKVMRFDDGSASVVCQRCANLVGTSRIFELPNGWRFNVTQDE